MSNENRPDPFRTGIKVTNWDLNNWIVDYQIMKDKWSARVVDGNENIKEDEICIAYAVAPFGLSVRCLIVKRG